MILKIVQHEFNRSVDILCSQGQNGRRSGLKVGVEPAEFRNCKSKSQDYLEIR